MIKILSKPEIENLLSLIKSNNLQTMSLTDVRLNVFSLISGIRYRMSLSDYNWK